MKWGQTWWHKGQLLWGTRPAIAWMIMWGETDISEPRPLLNYCSFPVGAEVMPAGDKFWLLIPAGRTVRALWPSYQQIHLERVGRMEEGTRILRIQYLWYVKGSFTCRKILWHGTSGFTSHPKEGVLRVFSPLKAHRFGRVWTRDTLVQWKAH
jgi:hypothetical protein